MLYIFNYIYYYLFHQTDDPVDWNTTFRKPDGYKNINSSTMVNR